MPELPSKISNPTFKGFIVDKKRGYANLTAAQKDSLKKAGLGSLLTKKTISHQEALKALSHLQTEGQMPKFSRPAQIWSRAALKQQQQDLAAKQEKIKKNVRYAISGEIADDLRKEQEERSEKVTGFDKKYFGKMSDEIEAEKQDREKKIAARGQALDRLSTTVVPKKPSIRPIIEEPPDIFSGT